MKLYDYLLTFCQTFFLYFKLNFLMCSILEYPSYNVIDGLTVHVGVFRKPNDGRIVAL